MESTGRIRFSRSREQLYNSRFPGQESADQSCKKEEGHPKGQDSAVSNREGGVGAGHFFIAPSEVGLLSG